MSARSRLARRAQNQSRATSNSSTPSGSRVRSTTARGRDAPYDSLTRRTSDSGNNSPSTTLKRLSKIKITNNGKNEASRLQLSNNEQQQQQQQQQQQNVTTDEDADLIDDEANESPINISRTTTQPIRSSIANTTSTIDIVQNPSINDSSGVIPKAGHASRMIINQPVPVSNPQVYQLFDQMPNELFRCKLCQKEFKIKKYNTSNLRKHLGLVHKRTEFLYQSQRKDYSSKSQFLSLQRRRELHSAVISCIITDSRSFNDFRKAGMRAFLAVAVPGYNPPHRATIKAQLRKRFLQHLQLLRSVFAKIPAIALTSDIWKNSRNTHFISVTAHFYDINFILISLTIGFRQFIGDHSAKRIRKYISHEIRSMKINNKICSITTDNASNVVKATSNVLDFGKRISCLAHVINLIVQGGIKLWDKDSKEDTAGAPPRPASANANNNDDEDDLDVSVADADDIGYSSSDADDEEDDEEEEQDPDANNSSTDGELADAEDSEGESSNDENETELNSNVRLTDETLLNVFKVINRVRSLVRLVRRTAFLRDSFKKESRQKNLISDCLILDVRVRWNSTYYMLHRFISYEDIINRITMNPRAYSSSMGNSLVHHLKCSMLNHDEWEYIMATHNVLSTFEQACRLISGKRYQTLSVGFIVLVGLNHHLSHSDGDGAQNKIEKILNQSLRNAYDYHINDKIDDEQTYAMAIACFLDPQTYHAMNDDDKQRAQSSIIDEAHFRNLSQQIIIPPRDSSNSNNSVLSSNDSTIGRRQINHFLAGCGFDATTINSTNTSATRTIREEIAYYIDKVKNYMSFEEFWRSYQFELPCLTSLVRCFNVRPSSSVPSESLFSVAAYVNRKQRSSLSPESLMYSMILRDADIVERLLST